MSYASKSFIADDTENGKEALRITIINVNDHGFITQKFYYSPDCFDGDKGKIRILTENGLDRDIVTMLYNIQGDLGGTGEHMVTINFYRISVSLRRILGNLYQRPYNKSYIEEFVEFFRESKNEISMVTNRFKMTKTDFWDVIVDTAFIDIGPVLYRGINTDDIDRVANFKILQKNDDLDKIISKAEEYFSHFRERGVYNITKEAYRIFKEAFYYEGKKMVLPKADVKDLAEMAKAKPLSTATVEHTLLCILS